MLKRLLKFLGLLKASCSNSPRSFVADSNQTVLISDIPDKAVIGIIAGNGPFPIVFAKEARAKGHPLVAVCHENETDKDIENYVDSVVWIRVGQLGKMIQAFKSGGASHVAMAGGISRIKHFGDVKLDMRGAALIMRLKSTKDDVVMRGIAEELLLEGIEVIPCTHFLKSLVTPLGVLTSKSISDEEGADIEVGVKAILAMSDQDIGQLVVVREGVIVAVEAAEGTNPTIERGGVLGGPGVVVVKCAKTSQDMRFDVPTVGIKTIEVMSHVGARVLAIEAGRSIILEQDKVFELAKNNNISIVGINSLKDEVLA